MVKCQGTHQESMQILRGLALEIQDMDKDEKLETLRDMIVLEADGKGNRTWLFIAKCLLAKPELLSKTLNLTESELNPGSNIVYFPQQNLEKIQNPATCENNGILSSFVKLFNRTS